jgi:hypothetical protein
MIRLANIMGRSITLSEKGGTGNTGAASWSSTGRFERTNSTGKFGVGKKSSCDTLEAKNLFRL